MPLRTGAQLRAARALVRMEQTKLAELAKVSPVTVYKAENSEGPINARTSTLRALEQVLEEAGVVFTARGVELREPAETP